MLWDTIQLSKKDVKEQEKFIRDEKSLFDDPNVIIVEEIDPTKDLFYSIVGQIENAIPAQLLVDLADILNPNPNKESNGFIFNFVK